MSDNIDIPISASGDDGINRLVSALDRLHAGLEKLGNVTGISKLEQTMAAMQQSMTTGFTEMAALAKNGGNAAVQALQTTATRMQAIEQKRDTELNAMRQRQYALEQKRDTELNAMRQKQTADYVKFWETQVAAMERGAARQSEIQQKRDTETHNAAQKAAAAQRDIQQKRDMEEYRAAQTQAQQMIALQQKRDMEMYTMREKAAAQAASAAEKQRLLNTQFQTSSPAAQLRTATQAQAYGSMGGNAFERFGSQAATADIRTLQAAHDRLQQTLGRTTQATAGHNDMMREAHGLARGLAGSLGGLWLTYGSVIPLLAGAAIASSLKQIVTVGKEVEHQLNFVYALSKENQGVNLDQFLTITDNALRSVGEAANAMRALAQNGLEASQALQVLPSILDLATVGEMNVSQAAIAATGAVSAFGLSFAEAGRVADIFAKTAATSNTSVIAITESMKQASTVASLFKVSIEETAGVLGVLAKINITGGAAGTSMTNMLTGLYEPTEKGKKALKELGLETTTATGALKPFTLLMEEMRTKLAGFNDAAKVDILGSIFTIRGVKSVQQVQENLGEYKKKVAEATTATGYMRDVMMKLENDTTGAFSRLGVVIENTFARSFAQAQPYVQQMALHLADMFKGGSAESSIGNFATNIARLSGALVENIGVVATGAAGYLAYRLGMAALAPVITTAMAATTASTAAQAAATAASIAHASATAAGAGTSALFTTAMQTQAAATAAATTAASAWGAVLLPVIGAVALAIAGAAALWLLFRDNTDEANTANVRMSNTLHVVNEQLDKEIVRLKEANALWDEKNGKYREQGSVTPEMKLQAQTQVEKLEKRIRADGMDPLKVLANRPTIDPNTGVLQRGEHWHALGEELKKAQANLKGFIDTEAKINKEKLPMTAAEKARNLTSQTREDLEKFALNGTEKDSKGKFYQPDAGIRAKYLEADRLKAELLDPAKRLNVTTPAGAEAEMKRIDGIRTSLKVLRDEVNASQAGRATKGRPGTGTGDTATSAARDAANAEVARLQGLHDLQRQDSSATLAEAKEKYRRGELGDLGMINIELREKLALDKSQLEVARAQSAVPGVKGGREQRFDNKAAQAAKQIEIDTAAAASKKQTVLAEMAEDERAYTAETLRDQGKYQAAYLSDWEAKNKSTVDRIAADRAAASSIGDTETVKMLDTYSAFLKRMQTAGSNAALGKELVRSFDLEMEKLQSKLDEIGANSGPGTGLAGYFENALAAQQAYAAALPQLEEKQRLLAENAKSGSPAEQKDALERLRAIQAEAANMRNIWVDMATVIENGLTNAFGKAGSALGKLLNSTISFGAKRQQIEDKFNKSDKGGKAQLDRINETTNAQINSYAEMTSAAKGFFKEGSTGYAVLGAAEKAFRAIEIGLAIQAAATKMGLVEAFTGLFVAGKATETAATVASVAPDVAASMAKGQASAAAAVANQGKGEPYTAWARMAAMAVAMGALGFVVSGAGGKGSGGGRTAAEEQKIQGTGTVFGDSAAQSNSIKNSLDRMEKYSGDLVPINRGMLSALQAIEASMTGLANLVVRTPGAVNGENFNIQEGTVKQGVGGILGKIFAPLSNLWGKTKQTVVDSGVQFGGSVRGLQQGRGFNQYASVDTTKSSWFGLSKKTSNSVQTQGLDGDLSSQFGKVFSDLEKALGQAAVSMGGTVAQVTTILDGLNIDQSKISLKGLSGDALTQALNATLSKAMDQMASAVFPALDTFRQVGEGYAETVMRLATNYGVLDAAMASIGSTFGATGLSSLVARERLIGMAGGIDKLSEQTKSFADNFMTEAERLAPVQKYVNEELARLGMSGLKTRDQFKQAVIGLADSGALATEAGAKTYTSLLALQAAFAEVTPPIEDLTKSIADIANEAKDLQDQLDELTMTRVQLLAKERAQLAPSNRALFDQIQRAKLVVDAKDRLNEAYERENQNIEDTIDRIGGLSSSWKTFRDGLVLGQQSTLTPEQKYAEARRQFDTTVTAARGGDTQAQERFEEVANNFLQASRTVNASGSGYTADFNRVLSTTDQAIQWAAQQVDVAKASLAALNAQVFGLIDVKVAVLSVADALKELTRLQLDYNANVPPVTPPPASTNTGGLSREDINAIVASIGRLQRVGETAAAAQIDAAFASTSAAAAETREALEHQTRTGAWNKNNMTNIQ
jgi:TP901 family phage tail tape measure protein